MSIMDDMRTHLNQEDWPPYMIPDPEALTNGINARYADRCLLANPYTCGTPNSATWREGYDVAEAIFQHLMEDWTQG